MARNRLPVIATVLVLFIFFSYVLLPNNKNAPPKNDGTKGGTGYSKHSSVTIVDSETRYRTKTEAEGGFAVAPEEVTGGGPPPPLVGGVKKELLHGETIMPKLGNETIKAELGRASWKLLHTTLARFPLKPTHDEREALSSFFYLFARLYPCGECATHFQALLSKYPPQTSSRDAAAQWGCFVHNQVNERLNKPAFDCGSVTEHYKCGCAESDTDESEATKTEGGNELSTEGITSGRPLTAAEGVDLLEENTRKAGVEVQRDGLMDGG